MTRCWCTLRPPTLDCIRHCPTSARCGSSKTGSLISPSKPTHDLGCGIRIPAARSRSKQAAPAYINKAHQGLTEPLLTASRSKELILVCQPGPVALKASNTSASTRIFKVGRLTANGGRPLPRVIVALTQKASTAVASLGS